MSAYVRISPPFERDRLTVGKTELWKTKRRQLPPEGLIAGHLAPPTIRFAPALLRLVPD